MQIFCSPTAIDRFYTAMWLLSHSTDHVALRHYPSPTTLLPDRPSVSPHRPPPTFPSGPAEPDVSLVYYYYYYNAAESKDRCWVHPRCHTRTHSRPIRSKSVVRGRYERKKKKNKRKRNNYASRWLLNDILFRSTEMRTNRFLIDQYNTLLCRMNTVLTL